MSHPAMSHRPRSIAHRSLRQSKPAARSCCANALRLLFDLAQRQADHTPHRNLLRRLTFEVMHQRGRQRRQIEFIHAQRARQRMLLQRLHVLLFADDDARLRPAQQFIAAEADDVRARRHRFLHRRFVRQTVLRRIEQRPAAEIVDQRDVLPVGEFDQFGQAALRW